MKNTSKWAIGVIFIRLSPLQWRVKLLEDFVVLPHATVIDVMRYICLYIRHRETRTELCQIMTNNFVSHKQSRDVCYLTVTETGKITLCSITPSPPRTPAGVSLEIYYDVWLSSKRRKITTSLRCTIYIIHTTAIVRLVFRSCRNNLKLYFTRYIYILLYALDCRPNTYMQKLFDIANDRYWARSE